MIFSIFFILFISTDIAIIHILWQMSTDSCRLTQHAENQSKLVILYGPNSKKMVEIWEHHGQNGEAFSYKTVKRVGVL